MPCNRQLPRTLTGAFADRQVNLGGHGSDRALCILSNQYLKDG
jgi:hypothetical protein